MRRLDEVRPGTGHHRRQKQQTGRLEQAGKSPDSRALLPATAPSAIFDTAGLPVAPSAAMPLIKAAITASHGPPAGPPNPPVLGRRHQQSIGAGAVGASPRRKFFTQPVYPLTKVPERFAGYEMLIHDAGLGERCSPAGDRREKCRIYISPCANPTIRPEC